MSPAAAPQSAWVGGQGIRREQACGGLTVFRYAGTEPTEMRHSFHIKLPIALCFSGALAACAGQTNAPSEAHGVATGALDQVDIASMPLPSGARLLSATYTPSGKVLVTLDSGGDEGGEQGRSINLATANDDGSEMRSFFSGNIPERPLDNGLRYMVFPDNRRIFLGDFVIECSTSLETCSDARLLPVAYPAEIADGAHVAYRWSEMIVAPDNRSVAWTTLLANYSAMVFVGELIRKDDGYVIAKTQIVSTIDSFSADPEHPDGVIPQTVRGGEVKQFMHGGTSLSLAGLLQRDIADSVVYHLATGEMEAVTLTPGYTETTIFSPDERLGVTMTTRFSPRSDPAIFGLVPRPYPDSLNINLNMLAYSYGVTGVRRQRAGNIGPALIDIERSKIGGTDYHGTNLNSDPEWVYNSPLSWHPSSTRAMWIEQNRDTGKRRIQVMHIPEYRPGKTVAAKPTPTSLPYAITDLSVAKSYARSGQDIDVKVYGKASGYISYQRSAGLVRKTYVDFSDDGTSVYSGTETTKANPRANSTYSADMTLSGPKPGRMRLSVTFGPITGDLPAKILFDKGDDGKPISAGFAEYDGRRLQLSDLQP